MRIPRLHDSSSGRDAGWCLLANQWGRTPSIRRFFAIVSRLGDGMFWYALMLVLVFADGLAGLAAATHLAVTGALALALYKLLKRWTRRPRPFASDVRITAWIAPLDEFSFPSGHTLHAMAFSLVAISHYPLLALVLAPFTLCVAMSRVVLGLHYPSDVLAATGIGAALASVSIMLAPGIGMAA